MSSGCSRVTHSKKTETEILEKTARSKIVLENKKNTGGSHQMNAFLIIVLIIAALIVAGIIAWRMTVMPDVHFIVELIMSHRKYSGYFVTTPRKVPRTGLFRRVRSAFSCHSSDCVKCDLTSMQDQLRFAQSSDVPCPLKVRRDDYDACIKGFVSLSYTFKDWVYVYSNARSKKHCRQSLKEACRLARTKMEVLSLVLVILNYGGDRFDIYYDGTDCGEKLAKIQRNRVRRDLCKLVYHHRFIFNEMYPEELGKFHRDQDMATAECLRGTSSLSSI